MLGSSYFGIKGNSLLFIDELGGVSSSPHSTSHIILGGTNVLDEIDNLDNWYSVYQHIFPDGKQYFGMTKAYPPNRWGKNGIGYRCNKEMTEAIMEHGWENVEHHIIQRNMTYDEASALEEALIIENKTYDLEFGYNDFIGHIRGRRSLISQSMAQTGKKRVCSEKQLAQLKRLHQYNTGRHRGKEKVENVG